MMHTVTVTVTDREDATERWIVNHTKGKRCAGAW